MKRGRVCPGKLTDIPLAGARIKDTLGRHIRSIYQPGRYLVDNLNANGIVGTLVGNCDRKNKVLPDVGSQPVDGLGHCQVGRQAGDALGGRIVAFVRIKFIQTDNDGAVVLLTAGGYIHRHIHQHVGSGRDGAHLPQTAGAIIGTVRWGRFNKRQTVWQQVIDFNVAGVIGAVISDYQGKNGRFIDIDRFLIDKFVNGQVSNMRMID